jgi:plastocyanin
VRKKQLISIIIIIIVVLVAVAAWFFVVRKPSKPVAQTVKKPVLHKLTAAQREAPHTKIFGNKVVVLINKSMFGPTKLTIKRGSAVVWTNMETTSHQVVTDDGKTITAAESPVLARGKSYKHVFDTVGTFPYHCNLHPNMKGTITVKE